MRRIFLQNLIIANFCNEIQLRTKFWSAFEKLLHFSLWISLIRWSDPLFMYSEEAPWYLSIKLPAIQEETIAIIYNPLCKWIFQIFTAFGRWCILHGQIYKTYTIEASPNLTEKLNAICGGKKENVKTYKITKNRKALFFFVLHHCHNISAKL